MTTAHTWRPLTVADVAAWSGLLDAVAEVEPAGERLSAEDLAEELDEPGFNPARDTLAALAGDGTLVAAGQVAVPGRTHDGSVAAPWFGHVHPDHRGRGLGAELMDRLAARAHDAAASAFPGEPVHVSTGIDATDTAARDLLVTRGYRPMRTFTEMTMALADVVPAVPGGPPGPQPYRPELETATHAAHLDAFATHWGSTPQPLEQWRATRTGSRTFRPRTSALILRGEEVAAYVLGYELHPDEVYWGQIGVRQAHRGQGLARDTLNAALAAATAAGYLSARLHVDAENPDGALRLYASAGFATGPQRVVYRREA